MGASIWSQRLIRRGFRLLWADQKPALHKYPIQFQAPTSWEEHQVVQTEVDEMLAKGAIEPVYNPSSPGFYSRLFTIPKSSGGFRPILDLAPLNRYLRKMKFKMDSPQSIRKEVREGDWACSLDLKDAYFHVQIRSSDRKWLRFLWDGQVYQYKVLPFGLSLSPWAFTRLVRDLLEICRAQRTRLHTYIDDWLVLASNRIDCRAQSSHLKSLATRLGFVVNEEKSDLVPSQTFTYLGMTFNSRLRTVRPTEARVQAFSSLLSSLLSSHRSSARRLFKALGTMESLSPLLPLGRVHKRPLQRELAKRFDQTSGRWNTKIQTSSWLHLAVGQWRDQQWINQPVPITLPPPSATIYTDASEKGWGAHWDNLTAEGMWLDRDHPRHINNLELEAVYNALVEFQASLPLGVILIRSDNSTVVALINNQGGTRAPSLSRRAEQILLWAQSKGWTLQAKHVAGSANVLADLLSRPDKLIQTEWTITHQALERIWAQWDKPMVDLFATKFSQRLPIYVSPVPDPEAYHVDAMDLNWSNLQAYAFPPWSILDSVIKKARLEGPNLILVAPFWPAKTWFPSLTSLSHEPPIDLRLRGKDLVQPRSGIPHGNTGTLNLHAWKLCGRPCGDKGCQKTQ